jgi:hypothetical protein
LTEDHKFNKIFVENAKKAVKIYEKLQIISPQHFIGLEMLGRLDFFKIRNKIKAIRQEQNNC